MTDQALAVTEMDLPTLGNMLVKSGYFKDARDQAQAVVKVLAGRELGIGPIASMVGIYIVEGKPSLSAQLIASCIQRSGTYKYRVRTWTETECAIEFFEGQDSLGTSSFTMAEAQRAGLANKGVWKQYPKAMLWARAMSQGARAYTPSVFSGPTYTPEELGAEVDGDGEVVRTPTHDVNRTTGEVIDAEPIVETAALPAPAEPEPEPEPAGSRAFEERTQLMQEWNALRTRGMKAGLTIREIDAANLPLEKLAEWTGLLEDKVIRAESVVGTDAPKAEATV